MDITANVKATRSKKSSNDFNRTFKSYSSKSTLHGVTYLCDEDSLGVERILWGIIVFVGLAFTIFHLIILFDEWQDSPTVTTLNTSFFPIRDIKFPQVTICPQGSVNNLVERVLFKQLTEYIKANTLRTEGHNMPWNLTEEEVTMVIHEFLENSFPNAKDDPSKYVRLLASKNPKRTLEAHAMLNYGNDANCNEYHDFALTRNINEQLNARKCPHGYELVDEHSCILVSEHQMPYEEAVSYCQGKGGEDLSPMEIKEAMQSTAQNEGPGIACFIL